MLTNRQRLKQRVVLRAHAEVLAREVDALARVIPVHLHTPAGLWEEPAQDGERRGLACPVAPEQARNLTKGEAKRQIRDSRWLGPEAQQPTNPCSGPPGIGAVVLREH